VLLGRADGTELRYRIVGSVEADPAAGRLSILSPLARRLVGRLVGDPVTAPFGTSESFAILAAMPPDADPGGSREGGGREIGARVLVIDDDPAVALALAASLRREGFDTEAVTDPWRALQRLREGRFAWLISDVRMAALDGRELAVRAKQAVPGLRVILMTALRQGIELPEGCAEALLEKPLPVDRVVALLRAPR
jgi:CheY-like chemotaxis protein